MAASSGTASSSSLVAALAASSRVCPEAAGSFMDFEESRIRSTERSSCCAAAGAATISESSSTARTRPILAGILRTPPDARRDRPGRSLPCRARGGWLLRGVLALGDGADEPLDRLGDLRVDVRGGDEREDDERGQSHEPHVLGGD